MVARSSLKGDGWVRSFLNGWQIAPIFTANSGLPFTPLTGTDVSLSAVGLDRPNLVGNPYVQNAPRNRWLNFSAFQAAAPGTFGNMRPYSLYAPHYVNVDTAVMKYIPVREKLQLETRAECFNCLNHPNMLAPNATLSNTSQFGTITAASAPRILQLSLKLDF
jgi:hypothetical protein